MFNLIVPALCLVLVCLVVCIALDPRLLEHAESVGVFVALIVLGCVIAHIIWLSRNDVVGDSHLTVDDSHLVTPHDGMPQGLQNNANYCYCNASLQLFRQMYFLLYGNNMIHFTDYSQDENSAIRLIASTMSTEDHTTRINKFLEFGGQSPLQITRRGQEDAMEFFEKVAAALPDDFLPCTFRRTSTLSCRHDGHPALSEMEMEYERVYRSFPKIHNKAPPPECTDSICEHIDFGDDRWQDCGETFLNTFTLGVQNQGQITIQSSENFETHGGVMYFSGTVDLPDTYSERLQFVPKIYELGDEQLQNIIATYDLGTKRFKAFYRSVNGLEETFEADILEHKVKEHFLGKKCVQYHVDAPFFLMQIVITQTLTQTWNANELTREFKNQNNVPYRLVGVVYFRGVNQAGHYTASVLRNGIWYYCNDKTVTPQGELQNLKGDIPQLCLYHNGETKSKDEG